jgi:hypothetical protein
LWDLEKISFENILKGQNSLNKLQTYKTICFGPLMRELIKEAVEHVHIRCKIKLNCYYHFTFTGLRSKCPGSAGERKVVATTKKDCCVNLDVELLLPPTIQ